MKPNCLYSTFCGEICLNIILCKKNLARSITWLDFWLISLMLQKPHFHIEIESKNDMHIEQCNVVVIIKYENKNTKTLEDTIS